MVELLGKPGADGAWSLSRLVAPTSAEDFWGSYFEQAVLVLHRGEPEFYGPLLPLAALDELLGSHRIKHPAINLVRSDGPIDSSEFTRDDGSADTPKVLAMFEGGATIILPHLHDRLPRLGALVNSLGSEFTARVQTNVYLTPADSQGFNPHYDTHDVFILQTHGSKDWRIYGDASGQTPQLPLRGQPFKPDCLEPGEPTMKFTLRAGDCVYIPRGIVHAAASRNEPSLHVTVGVMSLAWSDLLIEMVSGAVLDHPELRRAITPGFGLSTAGRAAALRESEGIIRKLAERLNPAATIDRLIQRTMAEQRPDQRGRLLDILGPELTLDTPVGPRDPHCFRSITLEGDRAVLRAGGRELSLPVQAREAAAAALSRRAFRPRELPNSIDDEGKLVLVRRLISEGFLAALDGKSG